MLPQVALLLLHHRMILAVFLTDDYLPLATKVTDDESVPQLRTKAMIRVSVNVVYAT